MASKCWVVNQNPGLLDSETRAFCCLTTGPCEVLVSYVCFIPYPALFQGAISPIPTTPPPLPTTHLPQAFSIAQQWEYHLFCVLPGIVQLVGSWGRGL